MKALVEFLSKIAAENKRLAYGIALIMLLSALIALKAFYNFHAGVQKDIELKKETLALLASAVQRGGEGDVKRETDRLHALEEGLIKSDKPSIAAALVQKAFKSAASKNTVTVISERPLKPLEAGAYTVVPIEFQLKTGLSGLKGLLADLHASNPATGVASVIIKASDNAMLDVTLVIQGAMKN
ncbi:hypothetical protein BAC1_01575 [uncultured bacterium]|nr:hypothetical protein BAC1_01575 [uncultured bacterium]